MNYEDYELTEDQLKAAKAVYRAMRKADKLGAQFWDNYGTLACYNGKKIVGFHMYEPSGMESISLHDYDISYWETLNNFNPGNSDDEIWMEIK